MCTYLFELYYFTGENSTPKYILIVKYTKRWVSKQSFSTLHEQDWLAMEIRTKR